MPRGPQRTSLGESRAQVLTALRAVQGLPLRVDEIASAVGLSLTATRLHLDRLVADGLVRAGRADRDRPGRPHVVYRALAAEAVDGAAAYRLLAGVLAAQLSCSDDPSVSLRAGRAWAARLLGPPVDPAQPAGQSPNRPPESAAKPGAGPGPGPGAVARLMALFDDGGFDPRPTPGGAVIELHRCPFLDLAAERAEVVCGVHLGFVRGALEHFREPATAKVTPVLDGSAPCLVHLIPTARRAGSGDRRTDRRPHPDRPDHP